MIVNDSSLEPKVARSFHCEFCDYTTCKYSNYNKHLLTDKHKMIVNDSKMVVESSPKVAVCKLYECECGRTYKYDSGYYRHKKQCSKQNKTDSIHDAVNLEKMDKDDLIITLLKQNSELLEIVKNGTHSNNNNHHTNSHNKTFNLQFFLNETCKNAMNIMDFVESIKLQLSDLERFGEVGYVESISDIITSNLKAMDITMRPVHCTDKKRETVYIRDNNEWKKEEESKPHLRKAIKKIEDRNIRMLPIYREKYPDCVKSTSSMSDKYDKMVLEVMGGLGDGKEKAEKIIRNISKCTTINKHT